MLKQLYYCYYVVNTLRLHGMSWGVKTTCFKAPGVWLGGSGVSIGGVRSLRVIMIRHHQPWSFNVYMNERLRAFWCSLLHVCNMNPILYTCLTNTTTTTTTTATATATTTTIQGNTLTLANNRQKLIKITSLILLIQKWSKIQSLHFCSGTPTVPPRKMPPPPRTRFRWYSFSHTIHGTDIVIYLHLVEIYGKCK